MYPYLLQFLLLITICAGKPDVYISRSDGIHGADINNDELVNVHRLKNFPGGEIIALAIDTNDDKIFWSDTADGKAGIYKGALTETGNITSDTRIVPYDDGIVVTGLAVDWVYKHLYWTDIPHSYVMVADYDGNNRVVAVTAELLLPRGIAVDPEARYLYLGDQGGHFILRCHMDGLFDCQNIDRTQHSQIVWPNQLYMDPSLSGNISWTDGWSSKVVSCLPDLTDCQETVVTTDSSSFVFGLVNSGSGLLVTSLDNLTTYTTQSNDSYQYLPSGNTYYIVSSDTSTQPQPAGQPHECTQNNGGCTQLCFPDQSGLSARCTCASYSNTILTQDKTCLGTDDMLIYSDGKRGRVEMISTNFIGKTLIAYSASPKALAYDPKDKMVFFSDSKYQAIYTVGLDGENLAVFLSSVNAVGSVEAMTLDLQQRRLYFLNKFYWNVGNDSKEMCSIEMAGIAKPEERVTVLNTMQTVTDIHIIQGTPNYLYYAVGLPTPGVYQMFLDGRISTRLSIEVTDPIRLTSIGDTLFVLDNVATGPKLIQYYGNSASILLLLPNPITTMTSGNGSLYFSHGTSLIKYSPGNVGSEEPVETKTSANYLLYVDVRHSVQPDAGLCDNTDLCKAPSVCIKTNNMAIVRCKCPSNKFNIPTGGSRSCTAPTKYILFGDVDGIKMTSLDDTSEHGIYTIIPNLCGNSNFHGLATDGSRIFFAGYDGKIIYTASKTGADVRLLKALNNVTVLSLAYFDHTLYWTGHYDCYYYTNSSACESYNGLLGGVFSLDVNTASSSSDSPVITIVPNVVDPNGVVADTRAVYWSELDTVRRQSLSDPSDNRPIMNTRTYSLQQNERRTHIYGGGNTITFKRFPTKDFDEQLLFSNVSNVRGMAVEGTLLFASDWGNQNIVQYDLRTHQITLAAENLGRPGQIVVFGVDSAIQAKPGSCPQESTTSDVSLISCQDDVDCIDPFKSKCCHSDTGNGSAIQCMSPSTATSCSIAFPSQTTFTWGQEAITSGCMTCDCKPVANSLVERCSSVQCPPLTGCTYSVNIPQECCPVCRDITTCTDPPTINGCQNIMLQLPETLPAIRDSPVIFTLADLDQIKGITAFSCDAQKIPPEQWEITPPTVTWMKNSQKVTLKVWDATCHIDVTVMDTTSPVFITTLNETTTDVLAKDNDGIELEWIPPTAVDNSGIKPDVTSTEQNGVRKPKGFHQISYTAMDGADNRKTMHFYFNVSIIPGLTCDSPPLLQHGSIDCRKDPDGVIDCSAKCLDPNVFKSGIDVRYRCVKGQWEPKFATDFRTACFEPQKSIVTINTTIVLSCTQSTVSSNNVLDCLQTGGQCFTEGITLCDLRSVTVQQESSSLTIKVQASATAAYQEEESTNQTLQRKITSVKNFFSDPSKLGLCSTMACSLLEIGQALYARSCEDGAVEYLVQGKRICGKCPGGTRFLTKNGKSECEKCPGNWYQDQEAQMDCKPCPADKPYSNIGSWLVKHCTVKTAKRPEKDLVITVVAVLCGFVALAAILGIVLIVIRRRRRSKGSPSQNTEQQSYANQAYHEPEDGYDKLPCDMTSKYVSLMDTKGDNPSSQYAELGGGASALDYDNAGATLNGENDPYEILPE